MEDKVGDVGENCLGSCCWDLLALAGPANYGDWRHMVVAGEGPGGRS